MSNYDSVVAEFFDRESAVCEDRVQGTAILRSDSRNLFAYGMKIARWRDDGYVELLLATEFSPTLTRHVQELLLTARRMGAAGRLNYRVVDPIRVENDRGTIVSFNPPTYLTHWLYFADEVPDEPRREDMLSETVKEEVEVWGDKHRWRGNLSSRSTLFVFQVHDYDTPSFSKRAVWEWVTHLLPEQGFILGEDYEVVDHNPYGAALYLRMTNDQGNPTRIAVWWFERMKLHRIYTLLDGNHDLSTGLGPWGYKAKQFPNIHQSRAIHAAFQKVVAREIREDFDMLEHGILGDNAHLIPNYGVDLTQRFAQWLFEHPKMYKVLDHENSIEYVTDAVQRTLAHHQRYLDQTLLRDGKHNDVTRYIRGRRAR